MLNSLTQTASEFGPILSGAAQGVSVAAVITVVILFLRRQKESQESHEASMREVDRNRAERDARVVAALDNVADRMTDLAVAVAKRTANGD